MKRERYVPEKTISEDDCIKIGRCILHPLITKSSQCMECYDKNVLEHASKTFTRIVCKRFHWVGRVDFNTINKLTPELISLEKEMLKV